MSDRVSATIAIGGVVPAGQFEALLDAIESEALGPDWGEIFETRAEIAAHIAANTDGVDLYAHEVAAGEFQELQAFCAEYGLVYRLTYDGYGGDWGPETRLHHADGSQETCSLDRDGGAACLNRHDLVHLGLATVEAVQQHLERFDRFRPGRLVAQPDDASAEGRP